jgi:dolichol kinase
MADEVKRRLVHAIGAGLPALYLLELAPWRVVAGLAVVGMAVAGVLEALRLSGRLEWRVYDVLTREYEQDNPAGYALYFVGMAVVAVGFAGTPTVAVAAMLMLAIGDPISGLLGTAGAEGVKEPVVLAVMFLVCFAMAVPFAVGLVGPAAGVGAAALGAVVATVADGVKPVVAGYVVDDNLTIPVGGGVALWLGLQALPGVV